MIARYGAKLFGNPEPAVFYRDIDPLRVASGFDLYLWFGAVLGGLGGIENQIQ